MNKICTTIEQSQKLIELGIDVNTADMFYADLLVDDNHKYNLHPLESYGFKTFEETKLRASARCGFIPAWSLAALLELTPNDVSLLHFEDAYQAVYDVRPYYITNKSDNPFDAVFEMVCWLKENNKL